MKILLCTPQPISQYLGISRVLIELQKEMILQGHQVELIGPKELGIEKEKFTDSDYRVDYQEKLKNYLIQNAHLYDVVDYDHEFLPYPRELFCKETLFVTRTVLLTQHLRHIKIPKPFSLRALLGKIKNAPKLHRRLIDTDKTTFNADLVNVPNQKDAQYLASTGIPKDKICIIPYGLSTERREDFIQCSSTPPNKIKIVFLGSFDYRKGALDFEHILKEILKKYPDARIHLLGAKGLFTTEAEILNFFSPELHKNIEITLKFEREEIGSYLKDATVGIYPSYMEGFPFGILEMLCAYIPVFAYDAPGAAMMLPPENLGSPGEKEVLAKKIITYIDKNNTQISRELAHESSLQFNWKNVSQMTIENYTKHKNLGLK